jgi:hypothetical protein
MQEFDDGMKPHYELLDATNVEHLLEAALSRWCAALGSACSFLRWG